MATKTTKVAIKFTKQGLQPPVFLAGSFSDPEWQPQEMEYIVDEHNEHTYHKEVEVEEGKEYQYKFRVGNGDWWVLNEDSPIATDDIGNRNNLLTVPIHKESVPAPLQVTESPNMSTNDGIVESIPAFEYVDPRYQQKDERLTQDDEPSPDPPKIIQPEPEAEADIREDKLLEGQDNETSNSSLVVEGVEIDSKPHDDNIGEDGSSESKDEGLLKTQDDSGYIVVGSGARTPDLANVAAEVADSAEFLDRHTPTPPISDEEAGRIGLRRLSHTPIPEVATIAAEVADSAATLDKEDRAIHIEIPPPQLDLDGIDSAGSDTVTPWEERAPRFSHECPSPPEGELRPASREEYEAKGPQDPFEHSPIDPNDPSIEIFPSDREAIYEQVRSSQRRLNEDQAAVECIPPSPVVGSTHHLDRIELSSTSPNLLTRNEDRSPSLLSIPEEHGDQEEHPELPNPLGSIESTPGLSSVRSEDEQQKSVDITDAPENSSHLLQSNEETSQAADESDSSHQVQLSDLSSQSATDASAHTPEDSSTDSPSLDPVPSITPVNLIESLNKEQTDVESTPPPPESSETEPVVISSIAPNHIELPASSREQVDREHITPPAITLPHTPFAGGNEKQLGNEGGSPKELVTPVEGPTVNLLPATPGTSLKKKDSDPFTKLADSAKSTAIEGENGQTQLKSRKTASPGPGRPLTPSSVRSADEVKSKNFLKAFLKLVFVDWIGGLILKLCGGGRHTLLAILGLLVLTIASALYYFPPEGLDSLVQSLYQPK